MKPARDTPRAGSAVRAQIPTPADTEEAKIIRRWNADAPPPKRGKSPTANNGLDPVRLAEANRLTAERIAQEDLNHETRGPLPAPLVITRAPIRDVFAGGPGPTPSADATRLEALSRSQVSDNPFGSHVVHIWQILPEDIRALPLEVLQRVVALPKRELEQFCKRVQASMFGKASRKAQRFANETFAKDQEAIATEIAEEQGWVKAPTGEWSWPDNGHIVADRGIRKTRGVETRDPTPAEERDRRNGLARRRGYIVKQGQPIRHPHPREGELVLDELMRAALRAGDDEVAQLNNEIQLTRRQRAKCGYEGERTIKNEDITNEVAKFFERCAQLGPAGLRFWPVTVGKTSKRKTLEDNLRARGDEEAADIVADMLELRRRHGCEKAYFTHMRQSMKAKACDWMVATHKEDGGLVEHVGGAPFLEAVRCDSRFCSRCARAEASRRRRRFENKLERAGKEGDFALSEVRFVTPTQEGRAGETLECAWDRHKAHMRKLQRSAEWKKNTKASLMSTEVTWSTPRSRKKIQLEAIAAAEAELELMRERFTCQEVSEQEVEWQEIELKRIIEKAKVATSKHGSWWHVHSHMLVKLAPHMAKTLPNGRLYPFWDKADLNVLWRRVNPDPLLKETLPDNPRRGWMDIGPPRKKLADVAKYVIKPLSMLNMEPKQRRELIKTLSRRRLMAAWGEWQGTELARLAEGSEPATDREIEQELMRRAVAEAENEADAILDEDQDVTADIITSQTARRRRAKASQEVGVRTIRHKKTDENGIEGEVVERVGCRREELVWTKDRGLVEVTLDKTQEVHVLRLALATIKRQKEFDAKHAKRTGHTQRQDEESRSDL